MSDTTVWAVVKVSDPQPRQPVKIRKGYALRLKPGQLGKIKNALEADAYGIDKWNSQGLLRNPLEDKYAIVEFDVVEKVRS